MQRQHGIGMTSPLEAAGLQPRQRLTEHRTILAIDPGSVSSAWVIWDSVGSYVADQGEGTNEDVKTMLKEDRSVSAAWPATQPDLLLIEGVAHYGMAVGAEVFDTVFWSGRFVEAWGGEWKKVSRRDVKLTLCGSARAKDANVRQALIDRFGGKDTAIGRKAQKGPLYGVGGHRWSALAIAITWSELHASET